MRLKWSFFYWKVILWCWGRNKQLLTYLVIWIPKYGCGWSCTSTLFNTVLEVADECMIGRRIISYQNNVVGYKFKLIFVKL